MYVISMPIRQRLVVPLLSRTNVNIAHGVSSYNCCPNHISTSFNIHYYVSSTSIFRKDPFLDADVNPTSKTCACTDSDFELGLTKLNSTKAGFPKQQEYKEFAYFANESESLPTR